MKRLETLELENLLIKDTRDKGLYGCEEITIGFVNNGHGNEIVDFMTMDSKGIIRCYEIKVSLQDLKSNAKKSWYGNYNYLVTTKELYDKIDDWNEYIPADVGIIIDEVNWTKQKALIIKRKCKKKTIDEQTQIMLKESMVRSIYHKMNKYKDASDPEKINKVKRDLKQAEKDRDIYYKRSVESEKIIYEYEGYHEANTGEKVSLKEMAKIEKDKYLKKIREEGKRPRPIDFL